MDYVSIVGREVRWPHPMLGGNDPEFADKAPTFIITPPAFDKIDELGQEMFRHGIIPVSQETLRATVIEAAFEIYGDEEGEQIAGLLDAVWQADEQHEQELAVWREQETERLRDMRLTKKDIPSTPIPTKASSYRQRAKAQLYMDNITRSSQAVRDLTVQGGRYAIESSIMLLRINLVGWENIATPYSRENGVVTEEAMQGLFDEIGREAFEALRLKGNELLDVSSEERKNSDSPLESEPPPNGSPEQTGELLDKNGKWTESDTAPALTDGSDQIIAPSSISTSDCEAMPERDTPTGELSPSNPSAS